jgi:very-short-patch-repair endonuclease
VGHPLLSVEGRYLAALLACGPGAFLSHRSAADALGLRSTDRATVDVTTPGQRGRKRPGIDAHGSDSLTAAETTMVRGIPCTTVTRTLLDLADVVDDREVERAIERAEQLRLFDLRALERTLARARGRAGASRLRNLVRSGLRKPTLTRSELEERFLRLCRGAGLPEPEVNAWIPLGESGGAEADFFWRDQRLAIETDGNESHGTRQAFERDRLRDQQLAVAGFRVVRFTWRQVEDEPDRVAATLRELVV